MSTAPPPLKPSPPPVSKAPPAAASGTSRRSFAVTRGYTDDPIKAVLYGPGGIGKTELCVLLSTVGVKPLFIDVERGTGAFDVARIPDHRDSQPFTWSDLRSVLHDDQLLAPFDAIVLDSITKAEEIVTPYVLENIPHEKGHKVTRLEDYGWGKGWTHVYDEFIKLLGDLDSLHRRGKHIICIAHECVDLAPNPAGDDWKRFEPRLYAGTSGKNSIRAKVKEWARHLFFIGYDVHVGADGKGKGAGTRTIYPREMPTHMAKSTLENPIPYEKGSAELWKQLLNKE